MERPPGPPAAPAVGMSPADLGIEGRRAAEIALLRGTIDVAVLFRADGTVIWVSPSVRPLLDYRPEELIGRHVVDLVYPDDTETAVAMLAYGAAHPLDGGLDRADAGLVIDLRMRARDGRPVDVELVRSNFLDTEGVEAILTVARPSAPPRALDRLLTALAHDPTSPLVLEQLVGFVHLRFPGLSAALYTPTLVPTWTSQEVPEILQCPGGPWERVIAEGQAVMLSDLAEGARRGEISPGLAEAARSCGYVACWTFPIPLDRRFGDPMLPPPPSEEARRDGEIDAMVVWSTEHREPVIGHLFSMERVAGLIHLSISRRRQVTLQEQRLADEQERNRRLVELDDLRNKLIFDVSHELRTPVTSIIGFAELAQETLTAEDPGDLEEYLRIITRNADRLLRLTGDLLLVGRLESGSLEMHVAEIDMAAPITNAVDGQRHLALEKHIDLGCQVESGPPLLADIGRIEQLVENLVANAIKYTDSGGRVTVRGEPTAKGWRITVVDNGMGIPAEEQERLFDQFFRGAEARNNAIAGSGLGLAIAAGIARLHGGSISVESEPGRGSTFTVELGGAPAGIVP